MAKICKSCGEYYTGDYCDKCGYGNKNIKSKALEKNKVSNKPIRFMTDEEKKVHYEALREQRTEQVSKKSSPKDRRNMLILVAVVVVGIVIAVLFKNGSFSFGEKTDVIKDYFVAISSRDYDKFVDCMPSQIKEQYENDLKTLGGDKSQYMDEFCKDFEEEYGAGFATAVEFGKEVKLEDGDMDMSAYKAQYGSVPSISEAYSVTCTVKITGSKGSDEFVYDCLVGKVRGKWKIFNLEYVVGNATAEDGLVPLAD